MAKRKAKPATTLLGLWRLVSMSSWGDRPLDADEPDFLEFEADGLGWFEIGAVAGDIDYREVTRDGVQALEFSWLGDIDGEPACGRGWVTPSDEGLRGMLFLHEGDDSAIVARRAEPWEAPPPPPPKLVLVDDGRVPPRPKAGPLALPSLQPAGSLFQVKLSLRHVRPPIWRRLLVPDCTLARFHEILQDAMGWTDSHLHEFVVDGERYSTHDDLFEDGVMDASRIRLSQVVPGEKFKFRYMYDFGDGWEHEVVVEKVLPTDAKRTHPECLAGKRACPPEDVGGPWGYMDFVEAKADPKHERHDELSEWYPSPFDPEAFDRDAINATLRRGR